MKPDKTEIIMFAIGFLILIVIFTLMILKGYVNGAILDKIDFSSS